MVLVCWAESYTANTGLGTDGEEAARTGGAPELHCAISNKGRRERGREGGRKGGREEGMRG